MFAWLFGLVLAAIVGPAGYLKVTGNPIAVEAANKLGYRGVLPVIGALEIAGALGVLVGLIPADSADLIGLLAGFGIIAIMVGAFAYHQRAGDELTDMVPAIVVLVIAALYLFAS